MVIHRTSNRQQFPVPYHTKKGLSWKMAGKVIGRVLLALLLLLLLLTVFGTAAHAAGLVDDTVDAANEYSKYPLDNYQLDFYVDSGWDWLPWNWLDGIGKQVMYGLYAITNFIWTISLYLSNATGYLIQEAYSLDFISSTADSIGKNMQTLAASTVSSTSPAAWAAVPKTASSRRMSRSARSTFPAILPIFLKEFSPFVRQGTRAVPCWMGFLIFIPPPLF